MTLTIYTVKVGLVEAGEELEFTDTYRAESSAEALEMAKSDYPDCTLYVVVR